MNTTDDISADQARIRQEALSWLRRMTSGEFTTEELEALDRWRAESRAHRQAFAEARVLWDVLGPVTEQAATRPVAANQSVLGRRALFGGAVAAAAAGIGFSIIRPPFDLWPSLSELNADYRTHTGEQKQVALTDGVAIDMNTQTSIALRPALARFETVELISGEAAIAARPGATKPCMVIAAAGRTTADNARFNIRKSGEAVTVSCLEGTLQVAFRSEQVKVLSNQQVTYDGRMLGAVQSADTAMVTAWQRGLIVFQDTPLLQVIDEVNRYRPGKIVLLDNQVGRRKVVAVFRLDQIGDIVGYMSHAFNLRTTSLPGGVVLLS